MIKVFYLYHDEMLVQTTNASIVPNTGDRVIVSGKMFEVIERIWDIDTNTIVVLLDTYSG